MNKIIYIITTLIFSSALSAFTINLDIQYQQAQSGQVIKQSKELVVEAALISNEGMHKTLFAIKLSNLIKSTLTNYHSDLNHYYDRYPVPLDCTGRRPCPVPPPRYWEQLKKEHSLTLLNSLEGLELHESFRFDSDVKEAINLCKKLADNMLNGEFGPVFDSPRTMAGGKMANMCAEAMMSAPLALHVTTGGVKDYSHWKKQVEDGYVPVPNSFIEEGFLSSFTLSLQGEAADQLISLHPAYAYDAQMNKLYLQVGMESNVTSETFKRPPLNLCFVIDISGSMAATDNTERTRLEWAKDAASQAIHNLNEQDILSIVLFDNESVVLLEPTAVSNKEYIFSRLRNIQPRNSTNLYAGLADGYSLVSRASKQGYENRVILFSDAGLNTGMTATDSLLRLVSDYAAENIGLTAIGIGENFHHDFIHKITMSKGGNAQFVHSGKDMMKFFRNFDFLVTPIAYNLKVTARVPAKLVKTYGVPMDKGQPLHELINVRTLFFTGEGGGAIVLEYDLDPFIGVSQEIPEDVAALMKGRSYKEGCPVPLEDLRYLSVNHWGYDERVHLGHMVVHAKLADELIDIFKELFDNRFPIERMELVDLYDADDDRSMAANNSSCFCFRPNTTTPGIFSNHSYGIAIDINPLINPYVRGEKVLPEGGRNFLDRSISYKGGITDAPDNVCYQAFIKRGYHWGGAWSDRQDYQHFSKNPEEI